MKKMYKEVVVDFASSAIMSVNTALRRFCFDLHLDSMDCAADLSKVIPYALIRVSMGTEVISFIP